jgi:hypothetical protein
MLSPDDRLRPTQIVLSTTQQSKGKQISCSTGVSETEMWDAQLIVGDER